MGDVRRVEVQARDGATPLLSNEGLRSHWSDPPLEEPPGLEPIFKALADRTRRRILCLLHTRELAVNQIVDRFHLTQPSISRHLAILKSVGLVKDRRRGQRVIYHLGDPRLIEPAMRFLDTVFVDLEPVGLQQDGHRAR